MANENTQGGVGFFGLLAIVFIVRRFWQEVLFILEFKQ
jgi:hypothetical protein